MVTGTIITKYRPRTFDEVVGQKSAITSLKAVLSKPQDTWPHVFLFMGHTGSGKTTCAKILADHLGCHPAGIIEHNGATKGKVDDARALVEQMEILPMFGKAKILIMDEAQRMTTEAQEAMLKATEDAWDHAFYVFITTDDSKLLRTLKDRANVFRFAKIAPNILEEYAKGVICPMEGLQFPEAAYRDFAEAADGSVRRLLSLIDNCRALTNLEDIRAALEAPSVEDSPLIAIARLILTNSTDWAGYVAKIKSVPSSEWGGAKKILTAYLGKALAGKFSPRSAMILEALEKLPEYPDASTGPAAIQLLLYRTVMRPILAKAAK